MCVCVCVCGYVRTHARTYACMCTSEKKERGKRNVAGDFAGGEEGKHSSPLIAHTCRREEEENDDDRQTFV